MGCLEAVFDKLGQPLSLGYCNVGYVIGGGKRKYADFIDFYANLSEEEVIRYRVRYLSEKGDYGTGKCTQRRGETGGTL